MDQRTIDIYNADAEAFAREWEEDQAPPDDLRDAVSTFFRPGPTLDVGCGSGRDTAWLAAQGYETLGVDAAPELLAEARRRHPDVTFAADELPGLAGLGQRRFTNVLCETVIMHLPTPLALEAARRLVDLLAPEGALYLSWRVTEGADARDPAGRLYAAFSAAAVRQALGIQNLLMDERKVSASSKKIIHRMVLRAPEETC